MHRDQPLVLVGDLNRTQTCAVLGLLPFLGAVGCCVHICTVHVCHSRHHRCRRSHQQVATSPPSFNPLSVSACSQAKRGGGGVIIQDEGLWRALTSVVHQVGADHPPPPLPPPLQSYDEFHSAGLGGGVGRAGAGCLLQAQPGAAHNAQRGRRRVSTAAASGAAGEGGGDADSGNGSDSPAASIQQSSSTASLSSSGKGCKCKKGCSHGRCGCKRAGQPCGPHCGCKGDCANRYAAATEATSAPAEPGAAEQNGMGTAEAGAADTAGTTGTADQSAALPAPEVAAAAIGAAMERLAAASAAAAAVTALAPVMLQQGGDQAADAGDQQGPPVEPADTGAARSSMAVSSDAPAASGAASQQPERHGEEVASAAEQRCSCQKGCKDKRCPCRKAGRACGHRCTCQGCTNCPGSAAGGGGPALGGTSGGAASTPQGCTVC